MSGFFQMVEKWLFGASAPEATAAAAPDAFETCVAFTLGEEGGYVDNPADPGGATNMGITVTTLSDYLGRQCTAADVQSLSPALAKTIYKKNYWLPVSGDSLPTGVNLMVFDFGVNAGSGTSAKELQAALGVRVDGDIGPVTLAALRGKSAVDLIPVLKAAHLAHYKADQEFLIFGDGWTARLDRCADAANAMIAASEVS